MLNQTQLRHYIDQGYLVLKGAIDEQDIQRLERGVANNPPLDGTLDPNAPAYPCAPSQAFKGLTKREYIAVEAMKAVIGNQVQVNNLIKASEEVGVCMTEALVSRAFTTADAMIAHENGEVGGE